MNTKSVLSALINSIFTTNGNKQITGKSTRETLNTLLDAQYTPAGTPGDWFGPASTIPAGWHLCDGSSFSITDYADLFNALGGYLSPYGVNVSNGTFQIPKIPAGSTFIQAGTSVSGTVFTIGATAGEEKHTLTTSEMPSHAHKQGSEALFSDYGGGSLVGPRTMVSGEINSYRNQNTSSVGSDQAHNNMPPSMVVNKTIKLW